MANSALERSSVDPGELSPESESDLATTATVSIRLPRPSVPKANRVEVGLVIGVSALLHVGVAAAALSSRDTTTSKPISRVQIAMERAPRPLTPPPARVEPPPPLKARPLARAEQPKAAPSAPAPEPNVAPEPASTDTGSSAPAAENGELFAGSGGLGTAAPPPSAPPAPPAPKAEPAPVVQAHEGANYLKNPRPPYPSMARRQGWEGTSLLRVQVGPSGKPLAVQIQRSSGRSALDEAALEAVKRWAFVPATQGGVAVSGWVTVPIVFRLQ
ncbi:MAG: energy transducer TonB [Polyangiaceae bacterium]